MDEKLIAFAESFGHKVNAGMKTFVVANEEGEWLGYVQEFAHPPTIGAWKNPGLDTVKAIKYAAKTFSHNGVCLTMCHPDAPLFSKMERFGFTNSQLQLFFNLP